MPRFLLSYLIVLSLLLTIQLAKAQDTGDLFIIDPRIAPFEPSPTNPLDGLPSYDELLNQGARPGSQGSVPESILPQDLAEAYAYRWLERNSADDSVTLLDPATNNRYRFDEQMFLNGEDPRLLPPGTPFDTFEIDFIPNTDALCCFHSRLPEIILGSTRRNGPVTALGFNSITDIHTSQTALNTALDGFKQTPLGKDAFVKSGLLHTRNILLIRNNAGNNQHQGSPSQYKSLNKTIYINEADLKEYGYVVILHELIQAGFDHGLTQDYIGASDVDKVRNIGSKYFPNLRFGYLNSRDFFGIENFTTIKAFAFGQTYKLLKTHYYSLSTTERARARRFFSDIENNKYLFPLRIHLGGTGSATIDYHLMGHPNSINQIDIDDYTDSFMDKNSAVNKLIKPIEDKILKGVRKYTFTRLLPAIML